MPDDVLIEVRGVSRHFGRRTKVDALRNVDVAVERGKVTAFIGPNGAGKSTLFGIILGFLHASDGDVAIDNMHPRDYVEDHGVGYMPDRFSLPFSWPVGRAARAFAAMNGLPPAAALESLASFGIADQADKRVGALSRGLLQRLGLALAFSSNRDLIVLDEPAEALDPGWRVHLRDRIAQQRDAGRTVLLASHDVVEVERIADTVIVLERGTVKERIDLRTPASSTRTQYQIALSQAFSGITNIFPDATSNNGISYRVSAGDAEDLNQRIAALIDAGARVISLTPVGDGDTLEDHVRRTMSS